MSPKSEVSLGAAEDIWLTVSEVPLTTLPTSAPPPSRPSPSRPQEFLKDVKGGSSVKSKHANGFSSLLRSSWSYLSPRTVPNSVKSSVASSIDEHEDFPMGTSQSTDEHGDVIFNEESEENTAAAASSAATASSAVMKEAMDRAVAKLKHGREVREREYAAKSSGTQWEMDRKVIQDVQERDLREKQERPNQEQEQRERNEKNIEQRKIKNEREQSREIEEREKGRHAADRVMKEVHLKAVDIARQKAERAALDKVSAGVRERAGQAAAQKAQVEHERVATEAREIAEKADFKEGRNAEDKKAAAVASAEAEASIHADRASVNRATTEARERAASAAAASAATRENQQKGEIDLDNFFNMNGRPDSASRPSAVSSVSRDSALHNSSGPEGIQQSSAGIPSGVSKASSPSNIVDGLASFFGGTPLFGSLQETGRESDERQRATLERHQRTQERIDKALAERNERDRHTQWEQTERHRISESLDFEIKRWAAGKEGNLRALLSTLQYVLWSECGWQPVSLADLITSASVKKIYRKATLCIHPDKMQQKGANLQQKFIAEKVFDLLKEAWNKFQGSENPA